MDKTPEEIQQSASELIQRYEAEKAAREALPEKYKQAHMEKMKMGYAQVAQGVFGAKSSEEKSADSTSKASGANRPTIGSTTISTSEAEVIRNEVRSTLHKVFRAYI